MQQVKVRSRIKLNSDMFDPSSEKQYRNIRLIMVTTRQQIRQILTSLTKEYGVIRIIHDVASELFTNLCPVQTDNLNKVHKLNTRIYYLPVSKREDTVLKLEFLNVAHTWL